MWIKLNSNADYDESKEVAPGTMLDFGEVGNLIAIEIYQDASRKVDLSLLASEGLPVEARTASGETAAPRHG